jgi:hypothetical protein
MISQRIKIILGKYFTQSASKDELIELTEWLHLEANYTLFKDFVKVNYLVDMNMLDFETNKEIEKVLGQIKTQRQYQQVRKIKVFFREKKKRLFIKKRKLHQELIKVF